MLQLSKIVAKGSAFLITARTATKLEELRDEIKSRSFKLLNPSFIASNIFHSFQSIYHFKNLCSAEGIDVHTFACDAEKLNSDKILELQEALSTLIGVSCFTSFHLFAFTDLMSGNFIFYLLFETFDVNSQLLSFISHAITMINILGKQLKTRF